MCIRFFLMMIGGKGVGLCRCDVSEIFENISLSHFLVGGRREDIFYYLLHHRFYR